MSFKTRRRVGLMVETSRAYGRQLLRGAAFFARTRTDWSLLHQEMTLDSGVPDWMKSSVLSGVIARVDTHTVDPLRKMSVPIVDVRCNRRFPDIPQVDTDNQNVAELAFRHLWERGFRRFAFCGFKNASYSDLRLRFFQELVHASGCPLSIYESGSKPGSTLTGIEQSGLVDFEPMSQWLSSLEHPTGLFVCNDIRGQQVLSVCRTLQIAVPDDVGVIGVDDDEAVALISDPPLSSVCPDAERVGYRAAEILYEMIEGKPAPIDIELVAPKAVVERLSTQVIAVDDRELARVCRFIRQYACDGINVDDVTQFTTLSRRQLERRFQNQLGRTPREEITANRITRVKQLLSETTMTLEQIAPLAGFSHKERLSAVFKRETGNTPGEYRKQHQV